MGNKIRKRCPLCFGSGYKVVYPSTYNPKIHLNAAIFSARRLPDKIHGTIIKCNKCGLVRTREVVNPSTLNSLYSRSVFTYQNLTDNLRLSYGQVIKDASRFTKKNDFLEIGCGNGFILAEAQKIGFKRVFGVEPSRDAVNRAKPGIKSRIKVDILKRNLFKENSFDLIAAFQVFDHIPDPNKFLKICRSLLKPGGLLVLMNHDVNALSAKLLGEKSPIFDIEHTFLYSQQTISKMIDLNGLQKVKVYGPKSIFSIHYFIRMLPLPETVKRLVEKSSLQIFDKNIKFNPGNLAIYAKK